MKKLFLISILFSCNAFSDRVQYHYGQVVEYKTDFYGKCQATLVGISVALDDGFDAERIKCDTGFTSNNGYVNRKDITRIIK